MNDVWNERLSEYLDGDLSPKERAACDAHLATCETCRTDLAGLREVVQRARPLSLASDVPNVDLWPGILERLEPAAGSRAVVHDIRRHRWFERRFSLSLPQMAAAAATLMVVSGAGVWLTQSRMPAPDSRRVEAPVAGTIEQSVRPEAGAPTSSAPARTGTLGQAPVTTPRIAAAEAAFAGFSDPRYDATIAELERVLAIGRGTLDTTTIRILEVNLAIIDRAVDDARRAIAADPANVYLRDHLAATMRRKVDLLRRATVIANAQG